MGRIIINYSDNVQPEIAVQLVETVIKEGKISSCGSIPHYCWFSCFAYHDVSTLRKKPGQIADSFRVWKK